MSAAERESLFPGQDEAMRILVAVGDALRERGLFVTVYGNDGYRITPRGKGAGHRVSSPGGLRGAAWVALATIGLMLALVAWVGFFAAMEWMANA